MSKQRIISGKLTATAVAAGVAISVGLAVAAFQQAQPNYDPWSQIHAVRTDIADHAERFADDPTATPFIGEGLTEFNSSVANARLLVLLAIEDPDALQNPEMAALGQKNYKKVSENSFAILEIGILIAIFIFFITTGLTIPFVWLIMVAIVYGYTAQQKKNRPIGRPKERVL